MATNHHTTPQLDTTLPLAMRTGAGAWLPRQPPERPSLTSRARARTRKREALRATHLPDVFVGSGLGCGSLTDGEAAQHNSVDGSELLVDVVARVTLGTDTTSSL
jgi:hypothetical protein